MPGPPLGAVSPNEHADGACLIYRQLHHIWLLPGSGKPNVDDDAELG